MMVGFACNETEEMMPLTIALAHKLTRRLSIARREGIVPYLKPDGKSQVTVEYANGKPKRIDTIVVSTQHADDVSNEQIAKDVREHIINAVVPADLLDENTRILVNPSGAVRRWRAARRRRPHGQEGHRGTPTEGWRGTAAARSPARIRRRLTALLRTRRWVAKNIVAAGLADRCEVQLSYAIGVARPTSLAVETFGTGKRNDDVIIGLVTEHFDLRPGAIIRDLSLRNPIYAQTAAYGHFGRMDADLPWERTNHAAALRADAGLD